MAKNNKRNAERKPSVFSASDVAQNGENAQDEILPNAEADAQSEQEDFAQTEAFSQTEVFPQKTEFPCAVVDASYFIEAIFSPFRGGNATDGESPAAYIESLILQNGQIYVPQLFWFEIGNVLRGVATRHANTQNRPRISRVQLAALELHIGDLPIYTDLQPTAEIRMRIREIALDENLTYYDASYLELARRMNVPLKTRDAALLAAAKRA